jgi:hypothetical protein
MDKQTKDLETQAKSAQEKIMAIQDRARRAQQDNVQKSIKA